MDKITRNLLNLRTLIQFAEQKYDRTPASVQILAVSKTRPVKEICLAATAGQLNFGENYLQDAVAKIKAIEDPRLCWHFIGPVQSNKTRQIAGQFSWVHSIDRLKIARRLNDMRPEDLPRLNICIQVNISEENTKSGISVAELPDFIQSVLSLPRLHQRGLMTMPAPVDDFTRQREPFRQLRSIFDQLNTEKYELDTLSMGTSHDLEAAIAEGATMVRIGTAIFGPRT